MNSIKEKWRQDHTLTNAWVTIPSSWTAEILSKVGFDVMTIDAQHGLANSLPAILPMLQAMNGSQSAPFVRLPQNDPAFIMAMLDAGVMGLICPMINNAKETDNFVKATKYYPKGIRSFGPLRANFVYGESYFENANDNTITLAMIETPDAIKNIKEIAKVENLDGFYVGPWDLSLSMGFKKMADFTDPNFIAILQEILDVATKNNLKVGIHAGSPSNSQMLSKMGFRFVTTFNDSSGLKTAANSALSEYKGLINIEKTGAY